jgi:hypothetical protein
VSVGRPNVKSSLAFGLSVFTAAAGAFGICLLLSSDTAPLGVAVGSVFFGSMFGLWAWGAHRTALQTGQPPPRLGSHAPPPPAAQFFIILALIWCALLLLIMRAVPGDPYAELVALLPAPWGDLVGMLVGITLLPLVAAALIMLPPSLAWLLIAPRFFPIEQLREAILGDSESRLRRRIADRFLPSQ